MSSESSDKFYTPEKTKHNKELQQSTRSTGSFHYSKLRMIDNQNFLDVKRKGSLFLQRSCSLSAQDCIIQDRFIPSRRLIQQFDLNDRNEDQENMIKQDPQAMTVADIYFQEILGKNSSKLQNQNENDISSFKNKNLLKFKVQNTLPIQKINKATSFNQFNNNYVKGRKINKNPSKILDAPALTDDFYLNLVSWSHNNLLAVGLGSSIYIWNAQNSKVTRLCQLPNDTITSVGWSQIGSSLAIGCNKGQVLVWDVVQHKQIRKLEGHQMRIGSIAWSKKLLSTGSRDKNILQRDMRSSRNFVQKLAEHNQQICGLKWSKDDQYLASGGNDNKVIVWGLSGQSTNKFYDHKAAVKAIAWSPHHHGLLATGGGTADRMLKMRNIFTQQIICSEDTGSQVCNLQFSKTAHEIVSTHGYSQNQINIWSYPNMNKIASLKGHSHRVLYLAISPDGSTIVTGAGDQTLRFWNIFPSIESNNQCVYSQIQKGICFR